MSRSSHLTAREQTWPDKPGYQARSTLSVFPMDALGRLHKKLAPTGGLYQQTAVSS
jgi:hypothetical protein